MLTTTLWLITLGPLGLALVGLLPGANTPQKAKTTALLARGAAGLALALAVGTAVSAATHGACRTPLIGQFGLGFSLYVDALSAMMFCLVAFIGLIVVIYSDHYLDGDPEQTRFMRWLCLTLAAVLTVILSGNLLQFALAWYATSAGLHRLLVFYPERQAAVLAARKKFIASRIGDVCLLGAMVLLHRQFGSLEYAAVFAGASALTPASLPLPLHLAAALLVLTGLLKSAQFPLHGWLIEVMETPTPVSALLHAGIINAGGFLVLRFSDLISVSTPTLYALSIAGGLTALFGSVVMLTQTSIKVSLAYSTIAQMGFMMLECGLGAFSAALLHILAHSLYKAHAFLSSGSVIDIARASWTPSPGGQPHPARLAISIVGVLGVTAVIAPLFGASLTENPGVFALGSVLVLSLIHLVANGIDERPNGYVIGRTVALAVVVASTYFVLQYLMERIVAGSLPPNQALRGPLDLAIVIAVIVSFGLLTIFQSLLPRQATRPRWQALYAHISNGLYVNTLANRWILKAWPVTPVRGAPRPYAKDFELRSPP
jgi:NAD(P)H-quinone oxidoreductase subunit 5